MIGWIILAIVVPACATLYLVGDISMDWWVARRRRKAAPKRPGFTAEELDALREIARADAEAAHR